MTFSKRVVLHFPQRIAEQPIVYKLVKDYDLVLNILKASITPEDEGVMLVELSGSRENYEKGIEYLESSGVKIQSIRREVVRDEDRCTDCGACVVMCPTNALSVNHETGKILFFEEKCTACEQCVLPCPLRAMKVYI